MGYHITHYDIIILIAQVLTESCKFAEESTLIYENNHHEIGKLEVQHIIKYLLCYSIKIKVILVVYLKLNMYR